MSVWEYTECSCLHFVHTVEAGIEDAQLSGIEMCYLKCSLYNIFWFAHDSAAVTQSGTFDGFKPGSSST